MMLLKLLSSVPSRELNCSVISMTLPGKVGEKIRELGIPVYSLNLRRGQFGVFGLFRLVGLIRQSSPALVQTWMYHADLCGGIAAKIAGSFPVVWGIRNGSLDKSNKRSTIWTAKLCAKLSGRLPREITCVSHAAREFHEAFGYAKGKLHVIPNGFDVSQFHPDRDAGNRLRSELRLPPDSRLVGLVARFDRQKDHRNFICAARLVREQLLNSYFILCGDGVDSSNRYLADWIAASGAKESFRLLGRRDDIAHLTAGFDVAVSSSSSEGFSNAIGEAMACGVPCVVTDVGDSGHVVGSAGYVVPARDPVALANGICDALTDPRYSERGAASRARILDQFELNKVARQYVDLYRRVLHQS